MNRSILILPFVLLLARNDAFLKYALHAPHRVQPLALLDHWLLTPALLVALLLAAFGPGSALLRRVFRLQGFTIAEEFALSTLLGFGLMSFAVLVLGMAGQLDPGPLLAVPVGMLLISWRRIAGFCSDLRQARADGEPLNAIEIISLNIALWVCLHGLIVALSPPATVDVLSHHFGAVRQSLLAGRLFWAGNVLDASPAHLQMIYLLCIAIKSDLLAQLVSWSLGVFLIFAAAAFGARFMKSRAAGFLGAAILSAQPVFSSFIGTGMQDIGQSLHVFLAVYCLCRWAEDRSAPWLAMSGAMAGLAIGTKYMALPFVLVLGAALVALQLKSKRFDWKEIALFAAVTLAVAAPWFARNVAWTGNPLYPLFSGIFGGKDLYPEQLQLLVRLEIQPGHESPVRRWAFLIRDMVTQMRFGYYYNPEYLTWPLILMLALLPFFRPQTVPWPLALFAAMALFASFVLSGRTSFWRYFMPALPGLCLALAWAAREIARRARVAAYGVLVLMLLAVVRLDQENLLFPSLGFSSRQSYLETALPYYRLYSWMNEELPADAKIALDQQPDRYYLERPSLMTDPLFQGLIRYTDLPTPEAVAARLRELGVTHVLSNREGKDIVNQWQRDWLPDWYLGGIARLHEALRTDARLIREEGAYALYELNRRG